MVECFMCGAKFEPRPEKLKEWAESGRDFDPTDWECETCYSLTLYALDAANAAPAEGEQSPEVDSAGEVDTQPRQ